VCVCVCVCVFEGENFPTPKSLFGRNGGSGDRSVGKWFDPQKRLLSMATSGCSMKNFNEKFQRKIFNLSELKYVQYALKYVSYWLGRKEEMHIESCSNSQADLLLHNSCINSDNIIIASH